MWIGKVPSLEYATRFDGLFLPEKYVDSPLINKYPHPKIKVVEFKHIKAIGENADDEDAVPLEKHIGYYARRLRICLLFKRSISLK